MAKGFTLTELLVIISIVIILSTVSAANYRQGQKMYYLERSAHKLAQDLRRAQEMAMSTKECCGGTIPKGYGIYLVQGNSYYLLYADLNGDEKYDGGDSQIEEIYFENGVFIQTIDRSPLSINFQPPDPKIRIGDSSQPLNEVSIALSLSTDTSKTKTVRVNKAGLIYVE